MDEKSAKWGTKTGKNHTKNRKKPLKKSKFPLAHLTKGTPSAEKSPRTPAPGPVGSKKPPQNTPQNSRKKVIHNSCPRVFRRSTHEKVQVAGKTGGAVKGQRVASHDEVLNAVLV